MFIKIAEMDLENVITTIEKESIIKKIESLGFDILEDPSFPGGEKVIIMKQVNG